MATLSELSDDYMDAAIQLRIRLDELRVILEEVDDLERRDLENRIRILEQMLKEMRDLRRLTEGYYTRDRDGTYTMSTLRAPRVNSVDK